MKTKKKSSTHFSNMNGILCPPDMKQPKYKALYLVFVMIMLVYLAIILVPTVWMIFSGFKDPLEMYEKPVHFFPREVKLSKFVEVWNQFKFYKYYVNTFALAAGSVVFDVVVNGLAGYVLSRLKPKGSKAVHWLVMLLMMLPTVGTTVPLYKTFMSFPIGGVSLLNSYWPMWCFAATNVFNIILFKSSFDSISNSLIEAAKIDGANDMRIFAQIVIPMSIPVLMTCSIFTFNGQFGNFFWPYLVLSDRNKWTLGVWLFRVKSSDITQDRQMLTMFFAIIPQFLIFAFFNKYIIGGINLGGVKG